MAPAPVQPQATYYFEYLMGQSKPSKSIAAKNDEEARQKISAFLAESNGTLVGPIKASRTDTWELHLDPSPAKAA
jgi:hypothetical protein